MKFLGNIIVLLVGAPFLINVEAKNGVRGQRAADLDDGVPSMSSSSNARKLDRIFDMGSVGGPPGPRPTPPPPTPAPTPAWVKITSDKFEDGWGNFKDVGTAADQDDAVRVTSDGGFQQKWIYEGIGALRIRDNDGKNSSVFHKNDFDVTGCSNLKVRFHYAGRNMGNGDAFVLEYTSTGNTAAGWSVVKRFDYGQGSFAANDNFYKEIVDFNTDWASSYDFTDEARIRFRSDASGDDNFIYLDNVMFFCFQ